MKTQTIPETKGCVTYYGERWLRSEARRMAKEHGGKVKNWDVLVDSNGARLGVLCLQPDTTTIYITQTL